MSRLPAVMWEVVWLNTATGEEMHSRPMSEEKADQCLAHPGWYEKACPSKREKRALVIDISYGKPPAKEGKE